MSSPLSKDSLETITAWTEFLAIALTTLGAISGVIFFAASRPLKKIENGDRLEESRRSEAALTGLAGKVSAANLKASQADEAAGKANERAESLEKEAAGLRKDATELRKQNLGTEARLEKERATRLDMEKTLTPRLITVVEAGGISNVDMLKPFIDMHVSIECIRDSEAERAADSIRNAVEHAGWKVVSFSEEPKLSDGVAISARPYQGQPMPDRQDDDFSEKAGEKLQLFLEGNDWYVPFLIPDKSLPPRLVRVQVGYKPSSYFQSPEEKEIRRLSKEFSVFQMQHPEMTE
jgi:hypothetical protein